MGKEKQLKQEDANKCLKLENLEFKKTSNSLKLENRTVKEEIMKQNLEISELKEKLESNKEIIKKLREQNKGLLSNMVKNNSTIHNVSSKNGDSCFTSNSKKAQDKKQQEQDEEKKDHGNHVTPSLKLQYNNNSLYGYQLSNEYRTVTATGSHIFYVKTSEPLSQEYSSFWKVNIEQLSGWIAIGLIGHLQASYISHDDKTAYSSVYRSAFMGGNHIVKYGDKTCYSWDNNGVYIGGKHYINYGGWNGFMSGDEVFFRYELGMKKLSIKVRRLGGNQAFTLQCNCLDKAYIHVSMFNKNDCVTLKEMTNDEKNFIFIQSKI